MMKTGCTGTERPKNGTGGLRRVVLALAVLLLTCVLMAGAVSAENVEVSDITDLQNALKTGKTAVLQNDLVFEYNSTTNATQIPDGFNAILDLNGHDIVATKDQADTKNPALIVVGDGSDSGASLTVIGKGSITVNGDMDKKVWGSIFMVQTGTLTINSPGTFSANAGFAIATTNGKSKDANIIIKDGTFTSDGDVVFYLAGEDNDLQITGGVIEGSNGGVELRAGELTMTGGSIIAKGQPPEGVPTPGESTKTCSAIIMTWQEEYLGQNTQLTISGGSIKSEKGFAILNNVQDNPSGSYSVSISGSAVLEGSEIIGKEEGATMELTPEISGGTFIVHTVEDLEAYLNAGASKVQLGKSFDLTNNPITITKPVIFDGNNYQITGSSTKGYFLNVSVPLTGNDGKSVTLQNLNLDIKEIGSNANLGGITVCAPSKAPSVPVILKDSTVDMSKVTGVSGMNPAVYFVNAQGSQITGNTITAGSADSSSTRCVVVDGGSDVIVSGNKLNLGSVSDSAVAVGVEIKGNYVDKVTVSGNILATGSDSGEEPRAVKITAKDTGSQKTFTVSKNDIQFGGEGTTVEVLLSTSGITEEANAQVKLNVEENTGSTAYVVMLNKGYANGNDKVLDSAITLTGNIYNPALNSPEEVVVADGFTDPGSAEPSIDVTHVNPAPSSSGNMNNAYRVLFNDGATTLSVVTDLSSGDKLTKPEDPVKDGYTFA
ncbi:MAG TPA: hypothetical protein O0X07_04075, partial [Methanocorpusculum sp.]|nr:hypothetical protein [Methanocorpusculum sp.]